MHSRARAIVVAPFPTRFRTDFAALYPTQERSPLVLKSVAPQVRTMLKPLLYLALYGFGIHAQLPKPGSHLRGPGSKDPVLFSQHASTGTKLRFGSEDYACEELRQEIEELKDENEKLKQVAPKDGCGEVCYPIQLSNLAGNYNFEAANRCVEVVDDKSAVSINIPAGVSCAWSRAAASSMASPHAPAPDWPAPRSAVK